MLLHACSSARWHFVVAVLAPIGVPYDTACRPEVSCGFNRVCSQLAAVHCKMLCVGHVHALHKGFPV